MRNRPWLVAVLLVPGVLIGIWIGTGSGQGTAPARPAGPADAVQQAQTSQAVPITRPEQRKTPHDQQDPGKTAPSAAASETQPDKGEGQGFDFARDPFNAKRPDADRRGDHAGRHRREAGGGGRPAAASRVTLRSHPAPGSPGDDVPGEAARRGSDRATGVGRDLGTAGGSSARRRSGRASSSRTRALPHPKQATGGQVFPQLQIAMFPRLERFDVEFDLPEAFLPEFPPAIFLQNRPELGRRVARRGGVASTTSTGCSRTSSRRSSSMGCACWSRRFPQEEFNPTDDRKTAQPQPGRHLLRLPRERPHDRAVPSHAGRPAAAAALPARHDQPARRVPPADPRVEAEPPVGRGLHRVRAADRVLQRRSDPRDEEGLMNILDRIPVSHMAQFQNMLDFPPAPKLDTDGPADRRGGHGERAPRARPSSSARGGAATCHPAPLYLDHQMHDLRVERFVDEPRRRARSRRSPSAGSRTARPTSTTAGCSRSRTRSSSSTWSSA